MSSRHLSPWQSVRKESNLCIRSQSTTPSIPAESKKGYFNFDIHNAPGVKINQTPGSKHELTTSFVRDRPVEAVADVTSTQIAQLRAVADVREQRLQKAMSVIKSERLGHASRLNSLKTQFGTERSDIREALSSAQRQLSEYHISESSVRHLKEEHRLLELRVGELSKNEFDITARIAASADAAVQLHEMKEEHRLLELRVGELSKNEFDITARIAASADAAAKSATLESDRTTQSETNRAAVDAFAATLTVQVQEMKEEHRLLELRVGELIKKEFDITERIAASTEEAFKPTTHVGSTLSPVRGFSVTGARVPPRDDTKIHDFGAGRRVINTHFGQEHSFSIGSFPIGEGQVVDSDANNKAYGVALVVDLKSKYASIDNTRDIISAKGITA